MTSEPTHFGTATHPFELDKKMIKVANQELLMYYICTILSTGKD